MRVLIVHESLYGTNRKIAQAIASGLGTDAATTIVEAQAAPSAIAVDVDLLVVGGPNHKAGLPSPASRAEATASGDGTLRPAERGLREWLGGLRLDRAGQPAAVWDTRMATPRIRARGGPSSRGRCAAGKEATSLATRLGRRLQ